VLHLISDDLELMLVGRTADVLVERLLFSNSCVFTVTHDFPRATVPYATGLGTVV
jgi:hypothetical protein